MTIRTMSDGDIAQVSTIEQETFSEPWREEDFSKAIQNANNLYLVAEIDGNVVGYCGYWGIADEGDIFNVAVKKEYRGRKIGFYMLKELIKDASARGITALTLEVRSSNESALRLYESLGFLREGIRKNFYHKPVEDAVIMWLRLIQ